MSQNDTSIVIEPSKAAGAPTPSDTSAQAPSDPLATLTVPSDLDGVDAKYRGKSVKDIIDMHQNAEKALGEHGRELGVWRNLVTELSTAAAAKPATRQPEPQEEPLDITSDYLLSNPAEAIGKVVERAIAKSVAPIRQNQEMNARELEIAGLQREFPKMNEWGNDPTFQSWATAAPSRAADARAAAKGDTAAARRLLESWSDRLTLTASTATTTTETKTVVDTGKPQGLDGARQATTERGGTGGRAAASGKVYTSAEIVDMINNKPEHYRSEAFQAELKQAMREGRVVN